MPALALAPSLNQITSLTGRVPRVSLAESLRAIAPGALFERRQFEQEQTAAAQAERQAEQQARVVSLQEAALDLQARQQAAAQRQQTVGNVISGASTVAVGALAAKELGLIGGVAAPAAEVAGATTGAAAAEVGLGVAPAAASQGAVGTLGSLASAALPAAAGAGLGFGVGKLVNLIPGESTGARVGKGLGGAALGAGAGFLAGGPIGAIAGGLFGGLGGGGLCILVTACAEHPEEIALAKRYRALHMSKAAVRGYYVLAEPIAARMQQDKAYCGYIREALVEPLLRYGAYQLHETETRPTENDRAVAGAFLDLCDELGKSVRTYRRQTGEWV